MDGEQRWWPRFGEAPGFCRCGVTGGKEIETEYNFSKVFCLFVCFLIFSLSFIENIVILCQLPNTTNTQIRITVEKF